MKYNRLEKLLEESHQAYYWMGFLLADGSINFRKNKASGEKQFWGLKLGVSVLDQDHLLQLYYFLEATQKIRVSKTTGRDRCEFTIFNTPVINEIKKKFDIKQNKTHFPPDEKKYEHFSEGLLTSLIVGLIDGDGCIKTQTGRTDCSLIIKLHSNWLHFLIFIQKFLSKQSGTSVPIPIINNAGYARLTITNLVTLRYLKKCIKDNGLCSVVLSRKWDKIDENRISKREHGSLVSKLYFSGKGVNEIIKLTNLKKRTVVEHLNKLGIKFYDRNYSEYKSTAPFTR